MTADLSQNITLIILTVIWIMQAIRLRQIERDIYQIRQDNAALANWVIRHDPDLYRRWQQRHPTT